MREIDFGGEISQAARKHRRRNATKPDFGEIGAEMRPEAGFLNSLPEICYVRHHQNFHRKRPEEDRKKTASIKIRTIYLYLPNVNVSCCR